MCSTKTGSHLFHAVRQQLLSRTLSSGVAPPNGADWWFGDGDSDSLLSTTHRFGLKTGEFRAKISPLLTGSPSDSERVEAVIEVARQIHTLDHEIATWLVNMAPEYRFRTLCWYGGDISAPDYSNADVFPGRVDVYPDFVTAGAWNTARIARLILASISIRVTAWLCAPVDYKTTAEYAMSKTICEGTISEIIASVPYHLGWHVRKRELFGNHSELSGFACGETEPFKALPAYLLIWALTCVKNHDITTDEQRKWVKGRLKYIEEVVGIKYARVLNEVDVRFPSTMIRRDGRMNFPDVLRNAKLVVAKPMSPTPGDSPRSHASTSASSVSGSESPPDSAPLQIRSPQDIQ